MSEQGHHGLRLLSLDGGGIRGLSELLILDEIMKRIQVQWDLESIPYPCDYFNLMGGTSTGGIIALMLGRLRMPAAEAIECYHTLTKEVFSKKKTFGDGKFKAKEFEKIIKGIVQKHTGNAEERMMDTRSDGNACKTFVCTMPAQHISAGTPHLFRTYQSRVSGIETFNCTIWEAARATSAAPTFFKPIEIGEPGSLQAYIDGGMGCNNPITQVLKEAAAIFPNQDVACIISIGTGHSQVISVRPPNFLERLLPLPFNVLPAIKGIAVDGEQSAKATEERFKDVSNFYFRFNVEKGLQNIRLEQWDKLKEVTEHTREYIQDNDKKLAAAVVAVCERRNVVAVAQIHGGIQSSALQQAGLKKCPLPTPVFRGRETILDRMSHYFFNHARIRHVFVLHGPSGVGKSQIAFRFVETCQIKIKPSRFWDVFFVDASTAQTIEADLKSIALAKAMGQSMKDTLDWLAGQHETWLLIFDNADDPTLDIGEYFPKCNHGNILVTSRMIRRASSFGIQCQLSVMETDEATSLLLKTAGVQTRPGEENKAHAVMIAEELEKIALAVVHASAHIAINRCSLAHYLDIYRGYRGTLLQGSSGTAQKIDSYEWIIYITWKINFDRLSDGAKRFLQICAFMHHSGISEAIFQKAAVNMMTYRPKLPISSQESDPLNMSKEFLRSFGSSEVAWDVQKFSKIVSEIRSYSLINFDKSNEVYSMHPLVHTWTRATASKGEVFSTCVKFILGVSITWKFKSEDFSFRHTLIPHVDMALRSNKTIGLCVFAELALVYKEAGRWKEVEELEVQVKEARVKLLGAEHPETLESMANLAEINRRQGRWMQTEGQQVQVKEAVQRALGAEHWDTLTSMANLALKYQNEGRLNEAEKLQVEVMEASLRLLGTEHRDTLTSMANLALTYRRQGRWKEAEELQVQVKAAMQRVLGAEHRDTLTSMANLAVTYQRQGRLREAEELLVQVKEVRVRMLGADHPDTRKITSYLKSFYWDQGRWKEANELHDEIREARQRTV